VQKPSCVHPEPYHGISCWWVDQEDQTKEEAVNPLNQRRSCFLLSRVRSHAQLQKKRCWRGPSCWCEWACHLCVTQVLVLHRGKRWLFCSWRTRVYWTTALDLSAPRIVFFLMDGKSCPCWFACPGIWRPFGHVWISKMNRARPNARALVVHSPWSGFVPTRPHQNNRCQAVVGELARAKAKP